MADLNALIEQLDGLTLLEASELVKQLEEKWGVSAAAPTGGMMMAMPSAVDGDGTAAEEVEEKTEFDVVLTDVGVKKINVIKAVRALTSLGLKEAKDLVESAPVPIMQDVSKEAAEDAKSKLEAEGASADIK